jgi:hypothetical protein
MAAWARASAASKLIQPAAQQGRQLESSQAVRVIMRLSFVGDAIAASVHDISGGQAKLIA